MNPDETQSAIIEDINSSGDCFSQYTYLLEQATTLETMPEELQVDENLVKGCQSQVWIASECVNGLMRYSANSDTLLVKGILAIMLKMFSNQKPEDIVETPIRFLSETELADVLEDTRKNGVQAMLDKIVSAAQMEITSKYTN